MTTWYDYLLASATWILPFHKNIHSTFPKPFSIHSLHPYIRKICKVYWGKKSDTHALFCLWNLLQFTIDGPLSISRQTSIHFQFNLFTIWPLLFYFPNHILWMMGYLHPQRQLEYPHSFEHLNLINTHIRVVWVFSMLNYHYPLFQQPSWL